MKTAIAISVASEEEFLEDVQWDIIVAGKIGHLTFSFNKQQFLNLVKAHHLINPN